MRGHNKLGRPHAVSLRHILTSQLASQKSATSQFKSATSQCKSGMLQFKSATSRCSANSQLSFLQAKRRHVLVERVINSSSSARKSSVLGTGLPLLSYVFACWSSSTWRCSAWQMKQSAVLARQVEMP